MSHRDNEAKTEPPRKIFSLKELHAATNSFNYDNKLGEGRLSSVYWGQLSDGSQVTHLKLFKPLNSYARPPYYLKKKKHYLVGCRQEIKVMDQQRRYKLHSRSRHSFTYPSQELVKCSWLL